MKGWCPVHDRVFQAKDGLCPECGTALVTDEAPPQKAVVIRTDTEEEAPPGVVEQQRATPNRSVLIGIAAAVLVAFIAGLAFPDGEKPATTTAAPRDVNADLNIGRTRNSANIPLRLESFSQHGTTIVARISVRDGVDLELRKLKGAHTVFMLAGGGEISDNIAPRTTVSGFILSGTFLQRGDLPVVGIRIESLEFESGVRKDVPLDISDAWPATTANQPRASAVRKTIRPGDGRTLTVHGLVGWVDRLEVGISVTGADSGLFYDTTYTLTSDTTSRAGEVFIGRTEDDVWSVTVRFEDVPSRSESFTLGVSVERILAHGGWEWSFV